MFSDRRAAGERLADELTERGVEADIVLGIPRGGVPVAEPVAERLDAPLDIIVAKKIAHPENPEYAVGAVSADGVTWYDDEILRQHGLSEASLREAEERATARAQEKHEAFLDGRTPPDLADKRVLLVDDGIATGATMRACVRTAEAAGADRVTVAVPVASPTSVPELETEADEVIALATPERFRAVGQFYGSFDQVSTEETVEHLERAAAAD